METLLGTELSDYRVRVPHHYAVWLKEGWDYLLFGWAVGVSGVWQGMILKDSQKSDVLNKLI